MKRPLLLFSLLLSLFIPTLAQTEKEQGVITYESKMNLHRNIPAGNEQIKAMIPEYRTSKIQVFYTKDQSITKPLIEDEEDQDVNASSGGMSLRFSAPGMEIFFDRSTQQVTTQQDFMGKQYLIEDTLKTERWKFGTETKTIMGYECKQAYFTDETNPDKKREITAWFTDQLPLNLGPERFGTKIARTEFMKMMEDMRKQNGGRGFMIRN
jgi:GLPGLI family protein